MLFLSIRQLESINLYTPGCKLKEEERARPQKPRSRSVSKALSHSRILLVNRKKHCQVETSKRGKGGRGRGGGRGRALRPVPSMRRWQGESKHGSWSILSTSDNVHFFYSCVNLMQLLEGITSRDLQAQDGQLACYCNSYSFADHMNCTTMRLEDAILLQPDFKDCSTRFTTNQNLQGISL